MQPWVTVPWAAVDCAGRLKAGAGGVYECLIERTD